MSEITRVELADGEVIWARVSGQPQARDVGFDQVTEKLTAQIAKLAGAVVKTVREAVGDEQADEISVDFGVELSAKSGRVIGVLAEVGGTASIVVHLTWRGESQLPGMSRAELRQLLRDCLVQIDQDGGCDTTADPPPAGSGCFAAPGFVLTCSHVVQRAAGSPVSGRWHGRPWSGEVACASEPPERWPGSSWPRPDLAVIRLNDAVASRLGHPCVRLASRDPLDTARLFAIGRRMPFDDAPDDFPTDELHSPGTFGYLLRLVGDRFDSGMSGCAVLDLSTGLVCGLLKAEEGDRGGYAIPVRLLHELSAAGEEAAAVIRDLLRAHDRYHRDGSPWVRAQGALWAEADHAARSLLPPPSEAELLGLIADLSAEDQAGLSRLYHDCAGPGRYPRPGELHDRRDVALQLSEHLHDRGRLHPVIVLAESIADRHPASGAGLRDWSTAEASRQDSRELLRAWRAAGPAQARAAAADPMSAVIKIVPSAHAPDEYVFTLWRYRAAADIVPVERQDSPLRLDKVVTALKEKLPQLLGELAGPHVLVEFVLPSELFDHPVHQWEVFARHYAKLGSRYPVVIRDLERFDDQESRNHALLRWRWLTAQRGTPLDWLGCLDQRTGDEIYELFEQTVNDILVRGALGVPGPAAEHADAINAAIYAGAPVALWRLTRCDPPGGVHGEAPGAATDPVPCDGMRFRLAAGDELAHTPVLRLPSRVRELRSSLLGDAVLLWDDPLRGPHPRGLAQ
jgi:hypothetical protein